MRCDKLCTWDVTFVYHIGYLLLGTRGVDPGVGGSRSPENMYEGQSMFQLNNNVTFFHSKLLDNSASITSSKMKYLRQKWKVKLIFRGA